MSFVELYDKFDLVTHHFKEGLKAITVLSSFFKGHKRLLDATCIGVDRNSTAFQLDFQLQSGVDTLSTAMAALPQSLSRITEHYSNYSQSLQLEVIEPLDLFQDHFTSSNSSLLSCGSLAFSQVMRAKEILGKAKERYKEACAAEERANQGIGSADGERLEKAKKQAAAFSQSAKLSAEKYSQAITDYNTTLSDYEKRMPLILESLQQSEESRIHFLKYTIEKFIRLQQRLDQSSLSVFTDMGALVGNVNSPIDIRVFVDGHKSLLPQFQREEFEPFEALQREEIGEEQVFARGNLQIMKDIVCVLVPKSSRQADSSSEGSESDESIIDPDDFPIDQSKLTRLIDCLKTEDGRMAFLDQLESRKASELLSAKNLRQLADFFNVMLTEIELAEDRDAKEFYKVITLAQVFCAMEDGKRIYLNSLIAQHRIWADNKRWMETIEWAVATQSAVDKQIVQRKKQRRTSSSLFGTLKTFATKLPALFQKEPTPDKADKSSVFMVLSQFNFHMVNLGLTIDIASENVLSCCFKMQLDSERICVLLAELQANQHSCKRLLDSGDKDKRWLKRREKERSAWGDLLPLAHAAFFLSDSDHMSLLMTSKKCALTLGKHLLRIRMLRTTEEDRQRIRSVAWRYLLHEHDHSVDYNALLWKVSNNSVLGKEIEDVIAMDVQRSYQGHPHITGEILANLLRTYSYYDPDISYCQGMNYIAGNLYIQLQDEAVAFRCLVALIEKLNMSSLLVKNLPKLKLFFYQLDRLVGILLPELHQTFKEEMINSSHYSSPWFLTLFASAYQGVGRRTEVLVQIWDLILLVRPT